MSRISGTTDNDMISDVHKMEEQRMIEVLRRGTIDVKKGNKKKAKKTVNISYEDRMFVS